MINNLHMNLSINPEHKKRYKKYTKILPDHKRWLQQRQSELKDVLDIFTHSISQVIVKDIDLNDEKYKYLFTVDSINNLMVNGMPFRDAYQKIGNEVQNETYTPDASKKHTHIGSIHNLCLDNIRAKFPIK